MSRVYLLPLCFVVALAGCNQFRANERAALAVIMGPMCPLSAVLSDAVTVTKLRPGSPAAASPDPANVAFTAEMSKAELKCEYNMSRNTLSVDLSFAVRASRGTAAAATDPPLDFFVAVVDIDGNVLAKKVYQNQPDLTRNPNGQWTQLIKNFAVLIDIDKRPYDYEILTGFQLTPAELAYNRAPRLIPQLRP